MIIGILKHGIFVRPMARPVLVLGPARLEVWAEGRGPFDGTSTAQLILS
jgi:hypothetical protein